jgi:alkanesulfonate monooxygenase
VAVRAGETWVPQLARQLATLDSILGGRLTVNIISSEMPGETLDAPARYRRTKETMDALRTLLDGRRLDVSGEFMDIHLDPPRITRGGTCPPFYFGGLSDEARDAAAHGADVYLMWPDTTDELRRTMDDVGTRAAALGRSVRFGYRVHVVVRDTTQEAREAAGHLISAVDEETGNAIRARSLDSQSTGVRRQAELRGSAAGDGFVEPALWTGIGRARSGCGAAVVGSPAEVLDKLMSYRELGMEAFILSGYPHIDEAERFARLVLPHIPHGPLA